MNRTALWVGFTGMLLSCGDGTTDRVAPLADQEHLESDADELVLDRRAPAKPTLHKLFFDADRRELGHGIAHTSFDVRLGSRSTSFASIVSCGSAGGGISCAPMGRSS